MLRPLRRVRPEFLLAVGLLAFHAWAVWGYTGLWWSDHGRWLHEVERFAQGEIPYRDFQWHFPPLSLWIIGGAARAIGTGLGSISMITAGLALCLVMAYWWYLGGLSNRLTAAWVVGPCLILAFAYASRVGVPLPLGLYSPAALVGGLLTVTAAAIYLRARSDAPMSLSLGAIVGLIILSKQDFWPVAVYLLISHLIRFRQLRALISLGAAFTVGVTVIALTASPSVLLPLGGGFGHAVFAGHGVPSWEGLTVHLVSSGLVVSTVLLLATHSGIAVRRSAIVAAVAVTVAATAAYAIATIAADASGAPFLSLVSPAALREALSRLKERVASDPLSPLLLLLVLSIVVWRWRQWPDQPLRDRVLWLVGFALALRLRRAFRWTEWFEFLLTVPVLLLSLEMFVREASEGSRRAFRAALAIGLVACSLLAYHVFARGIGTRRMYAPMETVRGVVHWRPNEARDYRILSEGLRRVDPSGRRSLLAFAYTGGFNYFLARPNRYPFTQDFFFSPISPDSVLAVPRPGLLLVDHSFARAPVPSPRLSLTTWRQPTGPSIYETFDRPRFDRLRQDCTPVALDGEVAFTLWDCAAGPDWPDMERFIAGARPGSTRPGRKRQTLLTSGSTGGAGIPPR